MVETTGRKMRGFAADAKHGTIGVEEKLIS